MKMKGIGPQGLGTSKNNGYTVGEAKGSPAKKLKDLSGDGKVTRKDVLIGRGIIDSPVKQTYKESASRFKNFDAKNDTIIIGKSIDLPTATKIAKFNSRSIQKAHDEEKTFKEADGRYSVMKKYKKNSPTQQTVKDACYKKVKATYKVFPSAYASGAIAKCRKAKSK